MPGVCAQGKYLDFSKKFNSDVYNKGSAVLNPYQHFDCRADDLRIVLKDLAKRARDHGKEVLDIVSTKNRRNLHFYLLKDDMQVSIDDVRKHASHAYVGQPNRIAQDSQMLYQCLWNSLTVSAKRRINIYDESYSIQDNPANHSEL